MTKRAATRLLQGDVQEIISFIIPTINIVIIKPNIKEIKRKKETSKNLRKVKAILDIIGTIVASPSEIYTYIISQELIRRQCPTNTYKKNQERSDNYFKNQQQV